MMTRVAYWFLGSKMVVSLFVKESLEEASFVLIGPPTSGKSTIASMIGEEFNFRLIRGSEVLSPSQKPKDGSLFNEDLFLEGLSRILESRSFREVVFDGIPRTTRQTHFLVNWAKRGELNLGIIDIHLSDEEVKDRILRREICFSCQETYHPVVKPSLEPGKCDKDGGELIRRVDDDPMVVQKRLDSFHGEKNTILDVFKLSKMPVTQIDGRGKITETYQKVLSEIPFLSSRLPVLQER